jgi:signal transduction histidine kinase
MHLILRMRLLWVLFAALFLATARAGLLEAQALSVPQISGLATLEDVNGDLSFEQISSPAWVGRFTPWTDTHSHINFGFTNSAYWIRIPLQRQAQAPTSWVIEIPYFQLRTVDFFSPEHAPVQTGSALPLSTRPFFHRFFAFPVEVGTEPQHYYLRVTSDHSLTVPMTLWQEQPFRHHVQSTLILQALYFGGLIALLIYNLFLAISLKDLRFFLYTLFVGHFGMGMLAGNGFGQMLLWPGQGGFDGIAQSYFISMSGGFAMLFANRFLQAAQYLPWISRSLIICSAFYFLEALALLTSTWHGLPLQWFLLPLFILTVPAGGLVVISGAQIMRMGLKGARYFLLAWMVLWMGAGVAVLRAFELLPTTTFTSYSLQISSAIEMLLLALALADVVHLERQEREAAQRESLLANQRLLENARTTEARLEQEVQKRTDQLERALSTETQLLERYMRFGALISHEFRNPLGIVESQISLLRKEHERGQLHLEKRLEVMASATQRLLSLFNTWLKGDRLQQAMQEMNPQHIPLAAWLRELLDAQAIYHSNHPLELHIPQPVGDVWADESLLEVALLNLIDNACKYSEAGQPVVIETRQKPGRIGIAVTDRGCGIDSHNHTAILDDYFRVHPESSISGIGLGLAFVRRIVQMHQGELELKSAIGQGSSFCIWLPHGTNQSLA